MKARSILTIGLLAVILLVACAPAGTSTPVQPEATVQTAPQDTVPTSPPASLPTEAQPELPPSEAPATEAPAQASQPVATSRGPELEATDPSTVSLASGELQLVEFFRFT